MRRDGFVIGFQGTENISGVSMAMIERGNWKGGFFRENKSHFGDQANYGRNHNKYIRESHGQLVFPVNEVH
jgi:hypothetical protein